jgi:signal transduction histidine kinase
MQLMREEDAMAKDQRQDLPAETLQEELTQTRRQLAVTLDRSIELAQRATRAESAKRRFMARISSDIHMPLSTIFESSQSLAQQELTGRQRQLVNAIHHSAERLLELVVTSMADCIELDAVAALAQVHPVESGCGPERSAGDSNAADAMSILTVPAVHNA